MILDDSYIHIFADPESTNSPAIRAYKKAGIKTVAQQQLPVSYG
ncbi:hypothetical protein [Legionella santicrucis]|nr:hypothetical protein [Legionella santicrucis]